MIICPTILDNKVYLSRCCVTKDPQMYKVDPKESLPDCLWLFHDTFKGHTTLFIIDCYSANTTKAFLFCFYRSKYMTVFEFLHRNITWS